MPSGAKGFRRQCLQNFTQHKALDFKFEQVVTVALKTDWEVSVVTP